MQPIVHLPSSRPFINIVRDDGIDHSHARLLKNEVFRWIHEWSTSRIDSDECRYFSVSIRLYLFIYFYLDDLHFSDKVQGNAFERFQRFISTFSQSPRSHELGFWTIPSSPFSVHQRNRDLETEWFIFRRIIDYFQE